MQRFLTLWLTLLGAFWLTRAAVSALLFQRADAGPATLLQVLAVPLLQAALLAWTTQPPDPLSEDGFDPVAGAAPGEDRPAGCASVAGIVRPSRECPPCAN
jgi:hypothetical protein